MNTKKVYSLFLLTLLLPISNAFVHAEVNNASWDSTSVEVNSGDMLDDGWSLGDQINSMVGSQVDNMMWDFEKAMDDFEKFMDGFEEQIESDLTEMENNINKIMNDFELMLEKKLELLDKELEELVENIPEQVNQILEDKLEKFVWDIEKKYNWDLEKIFDKFDKVIWKINDLEDNPTVNSNKLLSDVLKYIKIDLEKEKVELADEKVNETKKTEVKDIKEEDLKQIKEVMERVLEK